MRLKTFFFFFSLFFPPVVRNWPFRISCHLRAREAALFTCSHSGGSRGPVHNFNVTLLVNWKSPMDFPVLGKLAQVSAVSHKWSGTWKSNTKTLSNNHLEMSLNMGKKPLAFKTGEFLIHGYFWVTLEVFRRNTFPVKKGKSAFVLLYNLPQSPCICY